MRYIKGEDRNQAVLFPESLDDYVSEDNPARFIEAFVDGLDMANLQFTHSETKDTGRKPYDPKDILKLYLYGYMNKVRSSRLLEKLTHQNLEVIWLLKKLKPDFKTIADFRKDNGNAIKNVFREFVLICRQLGVIGGGLVAIDGSKFRAQNSKEKNLSKNQVKVLLDKAEKEVNHYLGRLDRNDRNDPETSALAPAEIKERIKLLKESMETFRGYLEEMESTGDKQISTTDPDSRLMMNHGTREVSYNVQIAVDSESKLIVANDVCNDGNDLNQLHRLGLLAKDTLEAEMLEIVADAGYYNPRLIKICHDNKINCYVAKPDLSMRDKRGTYPVSKFEYKQSGDYFKCPAGEELHYRTTVYDDKKLYKLYNTTACKACQQRAKCTTSKEGRRIKRWIHEVVLEELEKDKGYKRKLISMRKGIVEHPFGTLKRTMNHGYFLCKGLEKVRTEFSLSAIAYNIKRLLNLVGFDKIMDKINFVLTPNDIYLEILSIFEPYKALYLNFFHLLPKQLRFSLKLR